jgi:flagellar biosynthesis/type III secretory pathway protein FliH
MQEFEVIFNEHLLGVQIMADQQATAAEEHGESNTQNTTSSDAADESDQRSSSNELKKLLEGFRQVAAQLHQEPERLRTALQEAALELGELLASKLVHEKISSGNYAIEGSVRALVDQLNTADPITITLHPSDLALLFDRLGQTPLLNNGPELIFQTDPDLERGNCRASTGDLKASYTLSEQLQRLTQRLRDNPTWDVSAIE